MTWSLLAADASGALGVAVASRFFAVGALCPHARARVGALATQALVNPRYAKPGLDLLAEGTPPGEVVKFSVKGVFVTPGEPAAVKAVKLAAANK